MSEPRVTFEEHGDCLRHTYRFHDDRIEREWKGLDRSGRDVIPAWRVAESFTEQTIFGYGNAHRLRIVIRYLLAGLVLHLGFEHPLLNYIGFVFYAITGLILIWAITKMKKETWIYVNQREGTPLFSLRVSALKGTSRDDLRRELQRYAREYPEPNQRMQQMSSAVTPAAYAPAAPAPAIADPER